MMKILKLSQEQNIPQDIIELAKEIKATIIPKDKEINTEYNYYKLIISGDFITPIELEKIVQNKDWNAHITTLNGKLAVLIWS